MKASDINLDNLLKKSPERGEILLGTGRMLLMRQDSMTELRRLLIDQLGDELAFAILMQFGYKSGFGDYKALERDFKWDSPADRAAAGPMMHSQEGIVLAEPEVFDFDLNAKTLYHVGKWKNSYEAQCHLEAKGTSKHPVCFSLAGYASGYLSAFLGAPVLAIEKQCAAMGDEYCVVEARNAQSFGPEADMWRKALSATDKSLSQELKKRIEIIESQQDIIRRASTPIMEIWDGLLVLPIIGFVDTERSSQMTDMLLEKVVSSRARGVIIDITGVDILDTRTADHFIKMAKSIRLLGANTVITGISPAIAQTLTHIDIDLTGIRTMRSLKDGLLWFIDSSNLAENNEA